MSKRNYVYPGLDERWTVVEKMNRRPLGRAVLSRVQEDIAVAQGKTSQAMIMGIIKANLLLEKRKERSLKKAEARAAKRLEKLLAKSGCSELAADAIQEAWNRRTQAALDPHNLIKEA